MGDVYVGIIWHHLSAGRHLARHHYTLGLGTSYLRLERRSVSILLLGRAVGRAQFGEQLECKSKRARKTQEGDVSAYIPTNRRARKLPTSDALVSGVSIHTGLGAHRHLSTVWSIDRDTEYVLSLISLKPMSLILCRSLAGP